MFRERTGSRRWVARLAPAVVLVAALASCGKDKSTEERVADRLDQALADHAEGRIDDAVKGYQAVLHDQPDNEFAHYNLGLVDQQAGKNVDAEREYRAAIAADPNFASALFNLAILRTEADPEEAQHLYRSVLALQPDNASAHLNLGFLLMDQADKDAGQRELDKAVELDPSLAARIPKEKPDQPDAPASQGPTTTAP